VDWIFRAKVNRVIDYRSLDLILDLGFGIKSRQTVFLSGYEVPDKFQSAAKSCLIIAVGGHRVICKSDKDDTPYYNGRIYLYESINMNNVYETVGDRRLPCLNRIMINSAQFNFEPNTFKSNITSQLNELK